MSRMVQFECHQVSQRVQQIRLRGGGHVVQMLAVLVSVWRLVDG